MKWRAIFISALVATVMVWMPSCASHPAAQPVKPLAATAAVVSNTTAVVSSPVYIPETTRQNDQLPDGVLAWNGLMQNTNVSASAEKVPFLVMFTNVSAGLVSLLDVHPSCGCTTAELPTLPWTLPAGASGQFPISVNLNVAGHQGTIFKSVKVTTDKGFKELYFRITIEPEKPAVITDADRERFMAMSKADRQAVFKGDCATCHVKHGEGKYGKALYDADCAICHEANPRPTMIADLQNLKVYTNPDFWKQWIAHGKAGGMMPAFATAEGGPLDDMQIASLVSYLNETYPSKVPNPQ